ncbi:Mdm33 family-domain-containing protein [Phaeosphaeriaceae sp. PMI808]|nr:Mdm33 family-domain-containing protein [Phaeosphaeriaceae sp. PMI808]
MRPLLQHASRSLTANAASVVSSSRSWGGLVRQTPSNCLQCQYRTASTSPRDNNKAQLNSEIVRRCWQRPFSASAAWLEDKQTPSPSHPIAMPSPASTSKPLPGGRVEDRAPEITSSLEGQERLQEEPDVLLKEQTHENKASNTVNSPEVADNIRRVPDESLPSHRERQRWSFSKRLSGLMDDLLPKLAIVTQKVNTYTGTDYSGVEALRREIKEQENLVKARRAAIDTAKHSLDVAHAQQASAQKEVVALLERKHSWAGGDLERYMSLIRSEHINDQAIKLAKDSVKSSEAALEEARTQLEKRERAQYHEEQIWSDTIRRNSTWVTFGLMGVNIFLLLLSLAILEPWRRRRMVREIKSTLEAHKVATEAAPTSSSAPTALITLEQNNDVAQDKTDIVTDATDTALKSAAPVVLDGELPTPTLSTDVKTTGTTTSPFVPDEIEPPPQPIIDVAEVPPPSPHPQEPETWRSRIAWTMQDVVSERVILIRRIDYTTAILQGAAAGAVITAALIALWRPT